MIALLGWVGAGVLLAAYALVSAKRLTGDGLVFQLLNVGGAAALALNSAVNDAWPSAVLNIVWVGIGGVAMFRLARGRQRLTEYQELRSR